MWNLIGLNDDGVDKSPYHRLEGNLLELKPFQIDLNQMSQLDRTNLSKVLTKIMVKLFLLDEYSFGIDLR